MAAVQRFTGADLYVAFEVGGATYLLSGDQTALEVTFEQRLADLTAGDDEFSTEKATHKALSATLDVMHIGASGTATFGNVYPGVEGTLVYAPAGTASGKPKGMFPAIVAGKNMSVPFDGAVTRQLSFNSQGGVWGTSVLDPDTHTYT